MALERAQSRLEVNIVQPAMLVDSVLDPLKLHQVNLSVLLKD